MAVSRPRSRSRAFRTTPSPPLAISPRTSYRPAMLPGESSMGGGLSSSVGSRSDPRSDTPEKPEAPSPKARRTVAGGAPDAGGDRRLKATLIPASNGSSSSPWSRSANSNLFIPGAMVPHRIQQTSVTHHSQGGRFSPEDSGRDARPYLILEGWREAVRI